jgi:hypothetical protein
VTGEEAGEQGAGSREQGEIICIFPNYQLPITNHQLPITNYQSPITNHQSPIINYQLSIINYQLPRLIP